MITIKDEFDASDESETDSYSDSDYEPDDLEITTSRKRTRKSRNLAIDQITIEYHSDSDVDEIAEPKTCEFCLKFFKKVRLRKPVEINTKCTRNKKVCQKNLVQKNSIFK